MTGSFALETGPADGQPVLVPFYEGMPASDPAVAMRSDDFFLLRIVWHF